VLAYVVLPESDGCIGNDNLLLMLLLNSYTVLYRM